MNVGGAITILLRLISREREIWQRSRNFHFHIPLPEFSLFTFLGVCCVYYGSVSCHFCWGKRAVDFFAVESGQYRAVVWASPWRIRWRLCICFRGFQLRRSSAEPSLVWWKGRSCLLRRQTVPSNRYIWTWSDSLGLFEMLLSRGEAHLLASSEVGLSLTAPASRPEASVNSFQSDANSLTEDGNGVECHSPPLCLTESKVTFLSLGAFSPSNIGHSTLACTPLSFGLQPARKICETTCPPAMNGEPQMSKFMSLARKFNCFYFNGKPHPILPFITCCSKPQSLPFCPTNKFQVIFSTADRSWSVESKWVWCRPGW